MKFNFCSRGIAFAFPLVLLFISIKAQNALFYNYAGEPNVFCSPYKITDLTSYNKKFHKKIIKLIHKNKTFNSYLLENKYKNKSLKALLRDNNKFFYYDIKLVILDSIPKCYSVEITQLSKEGEAHNEIANVFLPLKYGNSILKYAKVFKDFQADYNAKFYAKNKLPYLMVNSTENKKLYCNIISKHWNNYKSITKYVQFVFPLTFIPSYFKENDSIGNYNNNNLIPDIEKIQNAITTAKIKINSTVTGKKLKKKEQISTFSENEKYNKPIAFAVNGIISRSEKGIQFFPESIEIFYESPTLVNDIEMLGFIKIKDVRKYSPKIFKIIREIDLSSDYYFFPTFINDAFPLNIKAALKYKELLFSGNWEAFPSHYTQKFYKYEN